MSIRSAKDEDWDYVIDKAVLLHYANARMPDIKNFPENMVRETVRQRLPSNQKQGLRSRLSMRKELKNEALIAWDEDGNRAGCVHMRLEPGEGSKVAWVFILYVEPQHRGKGLGRELMARAEAWARENGANSILLYVTPGEEIPHHLYDSIGFVPLKVRMRKKL